MKKIHLLLYYQIKTISYNNESDNQFIFLIKNGNLKININNKVIKGEKLSNI